MAKKADNENDKANTAPAQQEGDKVAGQQAAQTGEAPSPTKPANKFGNFDNVRTKAAAPFEPPRPNPNGDGTYIYPKALLTSVTFDEITKEEDSTVSKSIAFHFIDESGDRQHTERIFVWDENDPKNNEVDKQGLTKIQIKNAVIGHVYQTFDKLPPDLGVGCDTLEDYFKQIVTFFNTKGKGGRPIYEGIWVWLKLLYYKQFLQFPYKPNFIERVGDKERPNSLSTNPQYDAIVQTSGKAKKAGRTFGGGEETPPVQYPNHPGTGGQTGKSGPNVKWD